MTDFKTKMAELAAKYNISHKRDIDWHNFVAEVEELTHPELRESEDERIRKWLLECVENLSDGNFIEVSRRDVLFYLEKQKYDRTQPVYDNQESFESALDKAWKSYNESGARTVDSCEDDYIECAHAKGFREGYLFGLKKQKEQKPKLYWHKIKAYEKLPCKAYIYKQAFEQENNFFGKATIPGFMAPNIPCEIGCDTWYLPVDDIKNLPKEGEEEQKPASISCGHENDFVSKPAEWSEEDEHYLNSVINLVHATTVGGSYIGDRIVNWLKNLPGRFNLEPKQEWSEEDEKKINFLSRLIEFQVKDDEYCFGDGRLISKKEAIEMLRSLRPVSKESLQPHWKPTEEQMKALERTIRLANFGLEEDRRKVLESLYEQLKKL